MSAKMIKEWRNRKKQFNDIFSPVEDNIDPRQAKMYLKDMGAETDEEAGVKFKDFQYLCDLNVQSKSSGLKRGRFC